MLAAHQCDAQPVSRLDGGYAVWPEGLGNTATIKPPQGFYIEGNRDLLHKPAVGFCGARKASTKALEVAQDCAEQVARHGLTVVSGYAAGVDITTHYHALKNGGDTIIVLPEGINHFRIKKQLTHVWDWSKVLVISQFEPDEIWQSWRAMRRNTTILALSNALIVIEAAEKGGTMNAGLEALKHNLALYVAEYEDEHSYGNAILIQKGARELRKSREQGQANLKDLFATVANGAADKHQSDLFHP